MDTCAATHFKSFLSMLVYPIVSRAISLAGERKDRCYPPLTWDMSTPVPISMVNDDLTPSVDLEEDWGHRRGTIRHEVSLPAVIHDRTVGPISCVIEDVSATGMLVALELFMTDPGKEPLRQGSQAELVFAPDPDAPADRIRTQVEIMWRTPIAIGVHFLQMDAALREGLRTIAKAAVEGRLSGEAPGSREATLEQRRIVLACRKTVEKLLPNIIWALRTEVTKRLRAMAETAGPHDSTQLRAEADLLDEKANAIGRTVERRFLQGYAVASDLDQTQELTMAHLARTFGGAKSEDKSGLVGEGAVERNSRIAAVGHAAEERYKAKYFALNVRLANVIGHPLDPDKNPLVPANACRILWEATVSHCDSPHVQRCLQHALQNRIVPLLGELYQAVDDTLDKEGAQRIFDMR